ncbi:MAG: FecR family protein [Bacteroidota bacterium]
MSKQIHDDDRFLARWLSGDLTEEELEYFKNSDDYQFYKRIANEASELNTPTFNKHKVRSAIAKSIENEVMGTKVTRLKSLYWISGIAACLLIFFSVFNLFFNTLTYQTEFGERQSHTLSDGSIVQLNADSKITMKRWAFFNERSIALDGEAYFIVTKGDEFTVTTENSTISVLGTEFNVNTRNGQLKVNCYEGKVEVRTEIKNVVLTEKMNFKLSKNKTEEWRTQLPQPIWINGIISFTDTKLEEVIQELERQFDVRCTYESSLNVNQLYSGNFKNDNLEIALKTVFIPTGISYEEIGPKTYKLSSK